MVAGIILLILAAMFTLYACRQYVLHRIADRRIAEMEQRFQLKVGYESLKLEGCNVVCLRGLSVIPENRDTIVTLKHLDIRLDLWKMLTGNIQIKEVNMDYLHINLQKDSTVANYDFLFRSSGKASETSAEASEANYAQRAHRILNWIYERIPDNGSITKLLLTERHDSHTVQFRLPELNIKDNRFETLLHVTEDSLNRQSWNITGLLSPSERNLHVKIHSTQDCPVKLPYLQRRFSTDIRFDTLTCSLTEIPDGRNQTTVKGLAELSGLNLFQPAISPDTIQLDKGALEYRLNISANAVELDSTSCIKFNQLTFHPYIRLENTHSKSDKPLGNWHFTAQINEPWFPAQQLFGSLPQGLFDSLYGLKTEGELSYHGLLDVDFNLLDSLKLESELKKRNFRIVHMGQANLCKMNDEFEYKVSWGCDLQTEHERYLTEKEFKRPVFVTDYPKEIKAFYMKMNEDNQTVAAMDCLVPGIGEIIGGSQREDDYNKLVARMEELGLNREDYEFYLDLRKYGSARHSGFGLGFERCVMYLTGMGNIRDVIPFPRTVNNCEL